MNIEFEISLALLRVGVGLEFWDSEMGLREV